jgi:ABC-type spermidine/putrescine transport system permease subunit II
MTPETLAVVASALTAVVGVFVAYQAYRGYRRNDSDTMRALAVGVILVAVVPFVVVPVDGLLGLTDAQSLVAVLLSHTLGLAVIYRSLD